MAILGSRKAMHRVAALVVAAATVPTLWLAPSAAADGCSTNLTRLQAPALACPPVAAFDPTPASSPSAPLTPGSSVDFDASASRGGDGAVISTYEWDWDGDGVYDQSSSSPLASHSFALRGAYTVGLRVTDSNTPPATATATHTVYVGAPPTPSFTVDRQATSLHQAVTFTGTATEPGYGGAFTYRWDFDGDGTYDDSASGATATHVYGAAGSYTPTVEVTDDIGVTATYTLPTPIVASNQPPTAQLALSASTIPAGGTITLDGSASSDADSGGALTYAWDLDGDGGFEMAAAPGVIAHSFPNPGVYNIHLRVTDVDGGSGVATATLTVTAPGGGGGGNGTIDGGGPLGTGDTGDGSASGSGNGTAVGSGPGSGSASGFTAGLSGSAIQKLKVVRKRGLVLTCSASRAATCSVTAWISAKDAKRLGLRVRGKRPVKVGGGSARVVAKRTAQLALKAAGPAMRALARARTLRISVQGTARDGSGATAALVRAIVVRR